MKSMIEAAIGVVAPLVFWFVFGLCVLWLGQKLWMGLRDSRKVLLRCMTTCQHWHRRTALVFQRSTDVSKSGKAGFSEPISKGAGLSENTADALFAKAEALMRENTPKRVL